MAEADRIAEFKGVAELMPDLDAGQPENAADEFLRRLEKAAG